MSIDHPDQWYGGRTYAQHGDDLAIINVFHRLKIWKPSYLDIGAHHPFDLSNTALLYQRGSRGINVEANPALMWDFQRHRPEDKNVCVAVGPISGAAKLNRVSEKSGSNSLLSIGRKLHDVIDVPMLTADEIVNVYADGCWPDLLSIDAEGLDLEILASIDYKRGGPKVICAEAVCLSADVTTSLRELMISKGYLVHSWAGSNMLLVRHDLRDWLY